MSNMPHPLADPVPLAQALLRCASVTPADAGAQTVLGEALEALGFVVTRLRFGAIENLTTYVRADFISNFARPGAFNDLTFGFVFHYRERTPDGALHGVFMQDRRDLAHVSTYIAEVGKTVEKDGANYLRLSKGVLLRPQAAGDSAMVTFDDFTIGRYDVIGQANDIIPGIQRFR